MPKPTSDHSPKLPRSLRKGTLPHDPVDVWEAGLGALAESLGGGRGRFDALIAEGRRVEAQGGKAVRRAVRQAEAAGRTVAGVVFETADDAVARLAEAALGAAGVPTRVEVTALRDHIARLEARLARMSDAGTGHVSVTVEASDGGWAVQVDGREASVHRTKKAAITAARTAAREQAPARLVVHRADGTVGEETEYA